MLTGKQIEKWKQLWEEARKDTDWVEHERKFDLKRQQTRNEIADLLQKYLSGEVSSKEFRDSFQRNVAKGNKWDQFGMSGFNGAMALNMLVMHVPESKLDVPLKRVIRLPNDAVEGRTRLEEFVKFIEELKQQGEIPPQARAPFFVSACWHFQNPDAWPIFYPCDQKVLKQIGVYSPSNKSVEDYFAFREVFLEIVASLGISTWDLEHLNWRFNKSETHSEGISSYEPPPAESSRVHLPLIEEDSGDGGGDATQHASCQLLLAQIGRKMGCNVWLASNDHGKVVGATKLGDLSLSELPNLGLGDQSQGLIRLIDVLWIRGNNQVVAAFEIEYTTSIFSGILRMSDLVVQCPNLTFSLYIVAPESKLEKVRKQLLRPTFQSLELDKSCGYFSIEMLTKEASSIMRWAKDPSAIKSLASYAK